MAIPAVVGLKSSRHLGEHDERRLARRWRDQADTTALMALAESNFGLVIHQARRFHAHAPGRASLDDLIQEGAVGLMVAARRFDPDAGTRLSTYATYWIRACLMEVMLRGHGVVRIGTTRAQRRVFFALGRARRRIERSGGEVNSASLAKALDVSVADVEAMLPRMGGRDASLDGPADGQEGASWSAVLPNDGVDPETDVAEREAGLERRRLLSAALRRLPSRELAIIRARHLASTPATLEELGGRLGVSRERVRQIESRAIARLRRLCSG
jgi:RNA polymerase sigma-32 factor